VTLDQVVDAQGAVTAVRPVSFTLRHEGSGMQLSSTDLGSLTVMLKAGAAAPVPAGKTFPFRDTAAVVRDLDAMRQAAADELARYQFAPPKEAPAIARVSVSFDVAAGTARAGAPQPLSGFAGVAGRPTSTFVVRDDRPAPDGTLRVGGAIHAPQKVFSVNPVYPQEAKDSMVQGVVVIDTKVAADGSVAEAWVVRSIPLLDGAALDAVRQWRFTPTLLNGVAVPVVVTVTVNFTLR
jgi:protein TonB